jgi:hypothetical protein
MCYILCTTRTSVYVVLGVQGGKRGGLGPFIGGGVAQGGKPPRKKIFFSWFSCHFWVVLGFLCPFMGGFSAHGFLPMVFYFRLRN